MEGTENKEFAYEFGKFLLDPDERILLSDGEPVHLPAREFDTLLLLVKNNGRALSKDEMIAAIWGDAFVEEGNLAKQISRLRKILTSNGDGFIETLPKHGYRFSADVRLTQSGSGAPIVFEKRSVRRVSFDYGEDAPNKMLPSGERGWSRWRIASVAMVVLLLSAVGFFYWYSSSPPENFASVKSIAVLPFKGVNDVDGDEYLRLGLTDALVTKLGSLKKIVVRPANAVRNYEAADPLAAGRELGVEAVLDGYVQRIDDRVRVTLQLIGVRDGRVIWAEKFDKESADIFAVQDAISEQVARALDPGLTGEEKTLLAKRYTADPKAHEAYVRGRFFWNKRRSADLKESVKHFNEATERDPSYALAYAGLADAYSLLSDYNALRPAESYPLARAAALKALELDENLAEARTSLAYVNMYYYWDWQGVESNYRRAIELNPNYATAHQWYSEYLAAMGRFEEALAEIRRAKEIDPLSPVINAGEIWILYFARRYDEAIEKGRTLAEMNPQFAEVHEYMKRCYDQKGMYAEAIAARQMRRKLAGYDPVETRALKEAAAAADAAVYWKKRREQEIDDAEKEGVENFDMAEIYAQAGDKEKSFEWLERSFQDRDYLMMYIKVLPNLDPLRSDPRFTDLLHRIGLSG